MAGITSDIAKKSDEFRQDNIAGQHGMLYTKYGSQQDPAIIVIKVII